jgi:predicted  nucleic acid-binding Zn-ribbon protein
MERRFPAPLRLAFPSLFLLVFFLLPAAPPARAADEAPSAGPAAGKDPGPAPGAGNASRVDLKNDSVWAVSVPLGTDNGITRESDFEVAGEGGAVALYPAELYERRFWSQPLSPEAYARVGTGTAVRPVPLDKVAHARVRSEGSARQEELKRQLAEARRQVARRKIEDLKARRELLLERRDGLEERVAAVERDLIDEEGRADWLMSSCDQDIDRALQAIADLGDERDELQGQRDALSRQQPYPRREIDRIGREIRRLNDRMDSERGAVRKARDRKRTARQGYLSLKTDWQKLVAERNGVSAEIRSIDRQIKELAAL